MRFILAALTISLLVLPATAQAPLTEASPLQLATDAFMGDYEGTWTTGEADPQPVAAQVIALGGGKYDIHLLPALYAGHEPITRLLGKREGDHVRVRGSADGARWQGTIENGSLSGTISDAATGTFTLQHIERISPSIGAAPPEGAIVLFDGTNTDVFVHPEGNPYVFVWNTKKEPSGGVNYVCARVWSPDEREVQFELGSDDGVKVWVNKNLVHANSAVRPVNPGDDKFAVRLTTGWNDVLMKIANDGGDWGYVLRLTGNTADLHVNPALGSGRTPLANSEGFIMDWLKCEFSFGLTGTPVELLLAEVYPPEGTGATSWMFLTPPVLKTAPCRWLLLEGGIMQVTSGGIVSKERFNDHRVHLEFRTPFMPEKRGQDRGNSGVYLQGRYEVQVLDSYGLEGLDNEAGGIYTIAPPRINMCYPPLQWQTYDIEFRAPRYDAEGNKTAHAKLTVWHNGVLVQDQTEASYFTRAHIGGIMSEPGPLHLQDHGNPVWYRNIWVEPLD